jgi:hypothetical protein
MPGKMGKLAKNEPSSLKTHSPDMRTGHLREILAAHKDIAKKLEELERKTEALALQHEHLAANTRAQFKQVFEAIRALMAPPEPKRRPIGFVTPEENKRS